MTKRRRLHLIFFFLAVYCLFYPCCSSRSLVSFCCSFFSLVLIFFPAFLHLLCPFYPSSNTSLYHSCVFPFSFISPPTLPVTINLNSRITPTHTIFTFTLPYFINYSCVARSPSRCSLSSPSEIIVEGPLRFLVSLLFMVFSLSHIYLHLAHALFLCRHPRISFSFLSTQK